ncbi:NAD(P)/FAD-dependent oxidoreductase [Allosphingosinicella indica]|uniref:D-amino-acid dehydrogenase n=1 Tax=Allosphingosinicella indica TaxID=941907 RepID=A0A1X7FY69_9SPHN|nr:FAD-binding oxidoreductase [Allosphingosinicella indica]SMF60810.1 D-amino-acid dehydrogenase [Allosphingosinicella indica]
MPIGKSGPAETAIVIGGGIIGLSSALHLAIKGLRVTIVDPQFPCRAASWGNAGHIAVEQVEPLASMAVVRSLPKRLFPAGPVALPLRDIDTWLPFTLKLVRAAAPDRFARGKRALGALLVEALPAWQRLADTASAGDLVVADGHYVVWESPATARDGRAAWEAADKGTTHIRDLTADERAGLAALLGRDPAGAARFEGTARIADPDLLAEALDAAFAALGGERHTAAVRRIASDQASVVLDDGSILSADCLVLAAGVASRDLLAPLGHKAPLIAERGYHIQSAASDWPADFPPVVFEDRSMIVTRFRSGIRAAGFVEFARSASPPDPRKWDRLEAHIDALGLPFDRPRARWMGARPTLPDYLPAIGRSRRVPNLFYAFGHQHLGLTLAPATGEAIAALVTGDAPALDLSPFDIARFEGHA